MRVCYRDADDKLLADKLSGYPSVLGNTACTKTMDPLGGLAKQLGGSKRNALLKWCQNRTGTYMVCSDFLAILLRLLLHYHHHHLRLFFPIVRVGHVIILLSSVED